VDDLALLVDLVSSGWRGVDGRLERLEQSQAEDVTRIVAAIEDLPATDAEGKPVGHFAAA
jgi:hypothetical protein